MDTLNNSKQLCYFVFVSSWIKFCKRPSAEPHSGLVSLGQCCSPKILRTKKSQRLNVALHGVFEMTD